MSKRKRSSNVSCDTDTIVTRQTQTASKRIKVEETRSEALFVRPAEVFCDNENIEMPLDDGLLESSSSHTLLRSSIDRT